LEVKFIEVHEFGSFFEIFPLNYYSTPSFLEVFLIFPFKLLSFLTLKSEAATLALLLLVTSPHFPFPIAVGMALSFSCSASLTPQQQLQAQLKISSRNDKCLQKVKDQVKTVGIPSIATSPSVSLKRGNWVKLICGASFEDVVDVRNLSLVYTLAGVDCIDCAADASVVSAVNEGIEAAREIVPLRRPWVMISVNDDEDLHFRKADHVRLFVLQMQYHWKAQLVYFRVE